MPAVTYPNPLLSGAVSSTSFREWLQLDPANDNDDTLENINGRLDEGNCAASFSVQWEHVQPDAAVRLQASSGTLNLDYFTDAWGGDYAVPASSDVLRAQPIPGAGRRFYLPYNGTVKFMWQIHWSASIPATGSDEWLIALRVDGTPIRCTRRDMHGTVSSGGIHGGYNSIRQYSGHYTDDFSAGWHDANMVCYPTKDTGEPRNQMRVWARNFIVWDFNRPT